MEGREGARLREEEQQEEEEEGDWCWGQMLASGAGLCPLCSLVLERSDSSGSLLPSLPSYLGSVAMARAGGCWENRAAYGDNDVVYIGDSHKPVATALSHTGRPRSLSQAHSLASSGPRQPTKYISVPIRLSSL